MARGTLKRVSSNLRVKINDMKFTSSNNLTAREHREYKRDKLAACKREVKVDVLQCSDVTNSTLETSIGGADAWQQTGPHITVKKPTHIYKP